MRTACEPLDQLGLQSKICQPAAGVMSVWLVMNKCLKEYDMTFTGKGLVWPILCRDKLRTSYTKDNVYTYKGQGSWDGVCITRNVIRT